VTGRTRTPDRAGAVTRFARWLFVQRHVAIASPLPPDRAAAAIERDLAAARPSILPAPVVEGPIGRMAGRDFRVGWMAAYIRHNSWASTFRGHIHTAPTGSLVRGSVGRITFTRILTALWIIGASVVALVTGIAAAVDEASGHADWTVTLVAAGLAMGLPLVVWLLLYRGHEHEDDLVLAFVANAVEGRLLLDHEAGAPVLD
jgi:hypothetical protein